MAKALAPAMLRAGGTSGDFIIFEETTELNQESNFTMNTFVEVVGWDFIFGLNILLRKNESWDGTDAEEHDVHNVQGLPSQLRARKW